MHLRAHEQRAQWSGARLHLRVSKDGYIHYSSREEIRGDMYPMRPGQDVQVELTPGATLRGGLFLHGQPYEKVGLCITAREENVYESMALTDAKGRFEMTDLAPGRYTVTAEYESMAQEGLVCPLVTGVEVKNAATAQAVELHLEEGILVAVTVVDAKTREPVRDEQVAATADTAFGSAQTDERGRCVLRLAAGQYKLGVKGWRDGKWTQFWQDLTVPRDAKELSVSMEIAARPFIRGRLVDSSLRPRRGTVRIGLGEPVTTSKDGAFACPEPWWSPGDVAVGYAFDETGTLGRAFFWKPGGEPNSVEIVADPLATVVGRIVDGNDLDIRLLPQGWELLNKPAPGVFVEKWINAENVTLEQYRGKVVALYIGVLPPKDPVELERMQNLLNEYGPQGLQVMAIHQRLDITWAGKVTEDDLRAFVASRGITFPLGIDAPVDVVRDLVGEKAMGNGAMYSLYDAKATPALYLIDKKGILRVSPKQNELDAWIKRLLRE